MAKSSEISDVSAASKLAATSDLAFMFHTVGRVIDHLYVSLDEALCVHMHEGKVFTI